MGRARPPRSAPSGPPSGSRACRSSRAAKAAFFGNKGNKIKSLIAEFHYPRYGPGQMWETMTDAHRRAGRRGAARTRRSRGSRSRDGACVEVARRRRASSSPAHVISSLPLRDDGRHRRARARPREVREAAQGLRYRDFLTVALVLDGEDLFPDNWIYIHEPDVQRRPHPELPLVEPVDGPGPDKACVGLEYFCFEGDDLWTMDDDDLVELATRELEQLGLGRAPSRSSAASSMRVPKAYPMYDADYAERVATIRDWLDGDRRTSSRSAATGCTATTTPTTRC